MARLLSPADLEGSTVVDGGQAQPQPQAPAAPAYRLLSPADLEGSTVVDDAGQPAPPASGTPVAKPGALESLVRGGLQGATLGFSDEIAGYIDHLVDGRSYEEARDAIRAKNKAAQEAHPWLYGGGELAGGAATALVPGLGVAKGAGLLKTAASAALAGGVAGVGGSEATDAGGLASDAAKGAVMGGLTGGALHLAGTGISKLVNGAAPRMDARVLEDVGDKALPSTRTKLAEMGPDVIEAAKANDLADIARDPAALKPATSAARSNLSRQTDSLWSQVDQTLGGVDAQKDVLAPLRKEQARLAANPAEKARAAKLQGIIDRIEDQHVPSDQLDQASLLRRLTAGAGPGKAERIGARADQAAAVLEQHGLTNLVKDPIALAGATDKALDDVGGQIGGVYDRLEAGQAPKLTVGDLLDPLKDLQNEAASNPALVQRAAALGSLADKVVRSYAPDEVAQVAAARQQFAAVQAEYGHVPKVIEQAKKLVDDAETAIRNKPVPFKTAREFATALQTQGFETGSYVDPKSAAKWNRQVAGAIKDVIASHVEEHAPDEARALADLNGQYSILKDLQGIARRRAAAAELQAGQPTGTGRMTSQDLRSLIDSVAPEPHIKPTNKNRFERRVAGILDDVLQTYAKKGAQQVPGAAELPRLQRFSRALDQVQAAADYRYNRAQFPPTGLRESMASTGAGGMTGMVRRGVVRAGNATLRAADPHLAEVADQLRRLRADRLAGAAAAIPRGAAVRAGVEAPETTPVDVEE